jgi:hypothetical protein
MGFSLSQLIAWSRKSQHLPTITLILPYYRCQLRTFYLSRWLGQTSLTFDFSPPQIKQSWVSHETPATKDPRLVRNVLSTARRGENDSKSI